MINLLSLILLWMIPFNAMEMLKSGKLYKTDFEKLGVQYTDHLLIDATIDPSRILEPAPGYEAEEDISRFTQAVTQRYEAPVYIKYICNKIGYGAFADNTIKKNEVVGEYTGNVVTQDAVIAKSLTQRSYLMELTGCYTGYDWPASLYIDAQNAGNFTRFINHSSQPNVIGQQIFDGRMWHVILIALHDIIQDQQLLIDYGKWYWDMRNVKPIDLTSNP